MARILVMEDSVLDSAVFRFLEVAGDEIVAASGATDARQILDKGGVRLMLTGVESRGRSLQGFIEEVARRSPAMAIVLVVGESTFHVGEALCSSGVATDLLRLPVTLVQIRDGVRGGLRGRDLLTPITDLRRRMQRMNDTDLSDASREILKKMAVDIETLATRARSVTGG